MSGPLYGLVAEFAGPAELRQAVDAVVAAGYRQAEAYTPFPVDGLSEALGCRKTAVPLLVLLGGVAGALGGFALQYYSSVIDYPLNVGGRPLNSWPMFIPVTFELTILGAALAGVLGMLALNGLPMPYHPLFHVPRFNEASQDRFFLCIESRDPLFDLGRTRELLESLKPMGVYDVPR